jgi:DNA primase
MAGYSPAVLDEVRAAVDIVDLVGHFVNLKKSGVNWKGLCPFHAEKTPSFMVNPRKGIFHCFGCGVGGDAFGFIMRQDRLSFPEAVRALAKTTGIALPEDGPARAGDSGREELVRVMDLAGHFYADALWAAGGVRAREYLERRGIDPELAKRFSLGYAPESWDALLAFMRTQRVDAETLERAGLVLPRQSGSGFYDRFRGRLMFAIRDLQGRVVAFGGRAFGDEQPKYLNSPETPLYSKGNLLYAADQARPAIQTKNRALLVEGYVDCLMAHQYGFTETVAALGTAFTNDQLRLLRRYCREAIVFFDGDSAGKKAATRAEELLNSDAGSAFWEPTSGGAAWANRSGDFQSSDSFRVKVALLPPGQDPDTFLRSEGAEAFARLTAQSRSILSYAFDQALAESGTGAVARATGFARIALMLAKVRDAEEADVISREAAVKLGVDPTQLWIEARKLQAVLSTRTSSARAMPDSAVAMKVPPKERNLIALVLTSATARASLLPILEDEDLRHDSLRAIAGAIKQRPEAAAQSFMDDLIEEGTRNLLAELLVEEREPEDVEAAISDYKRHLEREHTLRRQRRITRSITESPNSTEVPHDKFRELHQESRVVYGISGGVAQSLEHGPEGPQGAQTHE